MELWLSTLIEELDPRYQVELVATDGTIAAQIAASRPGTRVTVVPNVTNKVQLPAIWAHLRAFRAAAPDLVLVCHGQLYDGQYGIVGAAATRRPIVSVVHCVLPRTSALQATLLRGASKLVARFVGVSASVARATEEELHLAPGAVALIHNGVPEPGPASTTHRREDRRRRLLGCVGRLSPEKGYDIALRALAELSDCDLVILGEGPELGPLRALATSLGIEDRVRFEGWVDPPWTAQWPVDVLLVPSRYEGFGLVAVEAMLAGIPVVASDVAGLSEVLTHEKTGLTVGPEKPDDLARAVRRVLEDEHLRAHLVANASDDARRRFSPRAMVDSYESLFDQLAGTAPG